MLTLVAAAAGRPARPVAAKVPSAAAPFMASRRDSMAIVRTRISPGLSMMKPPIDLLWDQLPAVDRRPIEASTLRLVTVANRRRPGGTAAARAASGRRF